ncbi:MAG TPA: ATP-binding cassette domain-containing protein, partial [Verrucomicrobiae bacterium]|nr:ATP-binding cassette domain-containing protein [Verrucomicrobiae bacterium]
MNDPIIRTEQLFKTYSAGGVETAALRGIDLEIKAGSFTCIVGPSGHGKSTLMHLLGGLDRPTRGRVLVDGGDITSLDDAALARMRGEKIGFVFQFFNLLRSLTAAENIETAMMLAGIPEKRQAERAKELLELVGLADKA